MDRIRKKMQSMYENTIGKSLTPKTVKRVVALFLAVFMVFTSYHGDWGSLRVLGDPGIGTQSVTITVSDITDTLEQDKVVSTNAIWTLNVGDESYSYASSSGSIIDNKLTLVFSVPDTISDFTDATVGFQYTDTDSFVQRWKESESVTISNGSGNWEGTLGFPTLPEYTAYMNVFVEVIDQEQLAEISADDVSVKVVETLADQTTVDTVLEFDTSVTPTAATPAEFKGEVAYTSTSSYKIAVQGKDGKNYSLTPVSNDLVNISSGAVRVSNIEIPRAFAQYTVTIRTEKNEIISNAVVTAVQEEGKQKDSGALTFTNNNDGTYTVNAKKGVSYKRTISCFNYVEKTDESAIILTDASDSDHTIILKQKTYSIGSMSSDSVVTITQNKQNVDSCVFDEEYEITISNPTMKVTDVTTDKGNITGQSDENTGKWSGTFTLSESSVQSYANNEIVMLNITTMNGSVDTTASVTTFLANGSYSFKAVPKAESWAVTDVAGSPVDGVVIGSDGNLQIGRDIAKDTELIITAYSDASTQDDTTKIASNKITVGYGTLVYGSDYIIKDVSTDQEIEAANPSGWYYPNISVIAKKAAAYKWIGKTTIEYKDVSENTEIVTLDQDDIADSGDQIGGTLYMAMSPEDMPGVYEGAASIKIDAQKPKITNVALSGIKGDSANTSLVDAENEWGVQKTISFTAEDSASGISAAKYSAGTEAIVSDGSNYYSLTAEQQNALKNATVEITQKSDKSYTFDIKENGTYYIYVMDNVGNIAVISKRVSNIDTTVPELELTQVTCDNADLIAKNENGTDIYYLKTTKNSSFVFTAKDAESDLATIVKVSSNFSAQNLQRLSQTEKAYTGVVSFADSALGDGSYVLEYTVTNQAGSSATTEVSVVLDTTAPVATATMVLDTDDSNFGNLNDEILYFRGNVKLSYKITEDNLDTYTCKVVDNSGNEVSNVSFNEQNGVYTTNFAAAEGYQLQITGQDKAGNEINNGQGFQSEKFTIDTVLPVISDVKLLKSDGSTQVKNQDTNNTYHSDQGVRLEFTVKEAYLKDVNVELVGADGVSYNRTSGLTEKRHESNVYTFVTDVYDQDISEVHYRITATDYAAKENEVSEKKSSNFIIDQEAPKISVPTVVFAEGNNQNTTPEKNDDQITYFNGNVKLQFTVEEEYLKKVAVTVKDSNGVTNNVTGLTEISHEGNVYTYELHYTEEKQNVHFVVTAEDFSHDSSEAQESIPFTVDTKSPVISDVKIEAASEDTNVRTVGNITYFTGQIKISFHLEEVNLDKYVVKVGDEEIAGSQSASQNPITVNCNKEVSNKAISITVSDKAGNSEAEYTSQPIYIDHYAPVISSEILYQTELPENRKQVADGKFHIFAFKKLNIVFHIIDEQSGNGSGIEKVEYQLNDEGWKEIESGWVTSTDSLNKTVTVPVEGNFRGTISLRACDTAGISETVAEYRWGEIGLTEGLVVESETAHAENCKAEISGPDTDVYYNQDIALQLVANEFIGISQFQYKLGNAAEETITDPFRNRDIIEYKQDVQLKTEGNESNHTIVTFEITDQLGRTLVAEQKEYHIDTTAPKAAITYNDTPVYTSESGYEYYNAARTAIITVDDLNFNQETVKLKIIKDGQEEEVAGTELDFTDGESRTAADGTEYKTKVATYPITADGDYTVSISQCEDKAGNPADEYPSASFTVDQTAPEINVTYKDTNGIEMESSGKKTIDGNEYDIFTDGRKVTIEIDELSFHAGDVVLTATKDGNPLEVAKSFTPENQSYENVKYDEEGNAYYVYTMDYTFAEDGDYTFTVSYTDLAGQEDTYNRTDYFTVDQTAPKVTVTYDNDNVKNNKYYDADRTATITINELSFDASANREVIQVSKTVKQLVNGKEESSTTTDSISANKFIRNVEVQEDSAGNSYYVYTYSYSFSADAEYHFQVVDTDLAKQSDATSQYNEAFIVDKTKPVLSEITIQAADGTKMNPEDSVSGRDKDIYDGTVDISFYLYDANLDWEQCVVTVDGNPISHSEDVIKITSTEKGYLYSLQYGSEISDGNVQVEVIDKANRKASSATSNFCIDMKNPEITQEFTYTTILNLQDMNDNARLKAQDSASNFHIFSMGQLNVVFTVKDDNSGIDRLVYTTTGGQEHIVSVNNAVDTENGKVFTIPIFPEYKDKVGITVYDKAGRKVERTTEGIIATSQSLHDASYKGEIIENNAANANGFYNSDISLTFKTEEAYSGIQSVAYQMGSLINKTDHIAENRVNEDVYEWKHTDTIAAESNNNNNVHAEFTMTDNTGRKEKVQQDYKIDITKPVVSVEYNTDNAANEKYYNMNRTATITISERNFSNDGVQLIMTRNGESVGITPAFTTNGVEQIAEDGSVTYTYVMDYTFSEDGDYTFTVICTDLADNVSEYDRVDEFTIDQTLPTISMDISGTSTDSNGYYSEARTATITVNEHNFNEADFQLHLTATDNGESIAAPALSGFTSSGDVHTATIVFDRDEEITISADYTDMAGNAAETLAEQKFVVDLTDPAIEIDTSSLVENKTYGKAETVTPKILITDTNFTQNGVTIQVEGRKNGVIQTGIATNTVANGLVYTVSGIDADDVYTLTATVVDMSGREKQYTTTFHVNKNGSSYAFGNALQTMNKTYVKAVGEDLYVIETNVDPLTTHSVAYTRGGMIAELKQDADYFVSVATNSYGWQEYTYRINQSVFSEEGEYKVNISSTDTAGNNSDNSSKEQAISFVVDNTPPTQVVTGVEDGGVYAQDSLNVTVEVYDNIAVNTVDVVLNGTTTTYTEEQLNRENGKVLVNIPSSSKPQTLEVYCVDYAGNDTARQTFGFTVSTNAFITFKAKYLSKPAFWITAGCVTAAAAAGGIWLILLKKRKKEESE